ncbi:hypothetical protein GGR56DRAFT_284055 [Xylariaceae sp. FL0804]|nr:hypothetical protein GGR56DRAFT_284055 [Xylariaceae sp. FL0804]
MERDVRRDRTQWRGCHTFDNIICDGDQVGHTERSGGLKMGRTYYYYYELDGMTETHDHSLPTTTACPYLPGQTVNTLDVPREHQLRYRSASMNSLRLTDYKTMDPKDKFSTPRAAPPVPGQEEPRIGSSPSQRSARSLSPAPKWTGAARRFLSGRRRAQSRESERGRSSIMTSIDTASVDESGRPSETRSIASVDSVRSRELSPDSLRRFLSGDRPLSPPAVEQPRLLIPDDILEDTEDDDNFATSATSETAPFTTLSPPPPSRSLSASPVQGLKVDTSTTTLAAETSPAEPSDTPPVSAGRRPRTPKVRVNIPRPHHLPLLSTTASNFASPASTQSNESSRDLSQSSFFDDSEEEEDDDVDDLVSNADGSFSVPAPHHRRSADLPAHRSLQRSTKAPFTNYSLPRLAANGEKQNPNSPPGHPMSPTATTLTTTPPRGSPALVAGNEHGIMPVGNTTALLTLPTIDPGLEDLVNDMGWMAGVIPKSF